MRSVAVVSRPRQRSKLHRTLPSCRPVAKLMLRLAVHADVVLVLGVADSMMSYDDAAFGLK